MGTFKDDLPHGIGFTEYNDNYRFIGEFKNAEYHNKITCVTKWKYPVKFFNFVYSNGHLSKQSP